MPMTTLASMFGAIDYPVQPRGNSQLTMAMRMMDMPERSESMDEMDCLMQQVELQKAIVRSTSIGK